MTKSQCDVFEMRVILLTWLHANGSCHARMCVDGAIGTENDIGTEAYTYYVKQAKNQLKWLSENGYVDYIKINGKLYYSISNLGRGLLA